jgi:hypothetical protein
METEQSPLDQSRIIEAGLKACARMHFCIAQILKYSPPPDPAGRPFALVNHWEVAEAIEALCHAQATAFGCLFDDGRRPAWEKPAKRDYRLQRVAMVREKCGDLDIPNLRNKGIRNALAHFDERLLDLLIDSPDAQTVEHLSWSHRAAVPEQFVLIGVYFYDIDELYMFDEVLRLRGLQQELEQVFGAFGYQVRAPNPKPPLA